MAKNKKNRGPAAKPTSPPPAATPTTPGLIVWHPDAVVDLDAQVTDRQTRGRIHTSVDVFRANCESAEAR